MNTVFVRRGMRTLAMCPRVYDEPFAWHMSCVARINAKLKREYQLVNERDVGIANIIVSVHAV